MTTRLLAVVAGPPGSGRDEVVHGVIRLAKDKGKTVHYHHLFEYIVDAGKSRHPPIHITKENILNVDETILASLRDSAARTVARKYRGTGGVHVVSTPVHFEWEGGSRRGLVPKHVRVLSPDLFVVIIDDIIRVKNTLASDAEWSGQHLTLQTLATWRRTEIEEVTRLAWSLQPSAPVYIVAREHDPRVFFDLIFSSHKKKVYLSFPITGVEPLAIGRTKAFAKRLKEMFVVFDPLTIHDWTLVDLWKRLKEQHKAMPDSFSCRIEYDTGVRSFTCDTGEVEDAIAHIRSQIVDRDYRMIESSDMVVVYHPRKEVSAGVVCEMLWGKTHGKNVYAFYPYVPSPFFEYYAKKIFASEDEFLRFLRAMA